MMGFSNLASQLIMFTAILVVSTVLVGVFNNYVDSTSSAINEQQDFLTNQLKTSIEIEVIKFTNGTENQTNIYIENTGSTILDLEYVDVYVDGVRIPRNDTNRTISVISDTDTKNAGDWDPKEEVLINVNRSLTENETFKLIVTAQYNALDTEEFST